MRQFHNSFRNLTLLCFAIPFACLPISVHAGDASLVGKSVYPRDPSIVVKLGDNTIATGAELAFPIVVRRQIENVVTIWVSKSKQEGQVQRKDLLSATEAVPVYAERIKQNPDNLYAVFVLSVVWEDLANIDQSIEVISQTLREHPHAILFNRRGNLWQRKRDYKKAIQDYNESIRLDASTVSCRFNRGLAWSYLGQEDKAISDFDGVLRLSALYTSAYVARGSSRKNLGHHDRALADYTMAIILNSKEALAFQERASLWYLKGDYRKALADYSETLRLQPRERRSANYLNRGMVYVKLGMYQRALSDFDQAVRLDRRNATAYNNRGWIRATCPEKTCRNGKLALADAKSACELAHWNNPHHLSTLGEAYAEIGDFTAAIRWQEHATMLQAQQKPADTEFQAGSKERLACYRLGKPFREPRPERPDRD